MTIKALMVDVDGVLLVHPDPLGWSVHLERDLGLSVAALRQAFFAPYWDDNACGRALLRDRLAPVLARIAPAIPCDTLIDYWFANDAHVDRALLERLDAIRAAGLPVHLATVQEHERARYLWHCLDLRSHFDALHYAADLGAAKPDPAFFRSIEVRTGLRADEIAFIDDRPANVEAARRCGWRAECWTGGIDADRLLAALLQN